MQNSGVGLNPSAAFQVKLLVLKVAQRWYFEETRTGLLHSCKEEFCNPSLAVQGSLVHIHPLCSTAQAELTQPPCLQCVHSKTASKIELISPYKLRFEDKQQHEGSYCLVRIKVNKWMVKEMIPGCHCWCMSGPYLPHHHPLKIKPIQAGWLQSLT